jgi:LPPG:FO 2-phospho-L-lactate transferase
VVRLVRQVFCHGKLEHAFSNPAHMVKVDVRPHLGPGNQERIRSVHPIFVESNAFVCPDEVAYKSLGIDCTIRCPRVVSIAEKVVHTVDIEIAVDYPRQFMRALHDPAQFIRIDPGLFQEWNLLPVKDGIDFIVGVMQESLHEGLAGMGERTVANVMEKCGDCDECPFIVRQSESPRCHIRKEHRAKGVLKPGMVGPGIDKVGKAKLLNIAEALQGRGIQQRQGKILYFYIPMYGVFDDLHRFTKESSYTSHKSIVVMITFLSGGTGTPKLLRGMQKVMDRHEISVIVNTAEDIWISGNHISPDLDTVMYLFSGILNTDTWWGIRGDTFTTHEETKRLGREEFIAIGDRDRAVHIARGEMLRNGMRLTNATKVLCDRFGVRENVLPMTDTEVTTMIRTGIGLIHFQDFWIRAKGQLEIQGIERTYNETPVATEEALSAIDASSVVVIGPSNPITSISPILACEGIRSAIQDKFVVAVSPFIGTAPVSGPAGVLMKAAGFEPTSIGTFNCYGGIPDVFIQDIRDPVEVRHSLRYDTLMTGEDQSIALARYILELAKKY